MSMYTQFATDPILEKKGIWVDYGDFRVLIGRAGGANKKYNSVLTAKAKPFQRAINMGIMENDRLEELLKQVYSETIIFDWNIKVDVDEETGETIWERGIHMKDGSVGEFTKENVLLTFRNLPDVFYDIQAMAEKLAAFRVEEMEQGAKN